MEQAHPNPSIQQKPHKINPIFPKKTLWRGTHPENLASIRKCKPKMLSSLTITNIRSENIGTRGFRDLLRTISDAKRVTSLLLEDTNLDPRQITRLLNTTRHSKSCRFVDDHTQGPPSKKTARSLLYLSKNRNFTDLPISLISTPDINKGIACRLYKQLTRLNKLKTLSLEIPLCTTRDILPERLPRSLTSLNIIFKRNVDQQLLQAFTSTLHHCDQLKHLSLSFDGQYEVESSDAEIWLPTLQKIKSLQEFSLAKTFEINDVFEGVQALFEGFQQHLSHITTLKLDFAHNSIWIPPPSSVNSFFHSLFTNLEYLNHLEKLKLNLPYFPSMQNTHLQHFASALQNLKNLRNLACNFSRIKSPNEAILSLFQTIQSLSPLRVLDLTFFQVTLTRSNLETILSQIPSENLAFFNLNLGVPQRDVNRITPTKIIQGLSPTEFAVEKISNLWKGKSNSIFSGLSKFNTLSTLNFQPSNCNISTQDFKQLAHLLKGMNQLTSLAIEFPLLDQTNNNEALQNFTSCFRDIINLKELDLVFPGDHINDQQIGILASNLADCRKLESFKLMLRYAFLLSPKSLEALLAGLKDLQTLKFLHLLFDFRKAFQEKALFEFLQGLVVLRNLEDLKFVDQWGEAVRQIIVELPESLRGYENLKKLKRFIVNHSRFI